MIDRFVRRHFLEFKPYQSARSEAHRAEIFLDANELSFGSPVSLDGVSLNRYPDPVQRKLRESIASRIGVPVEMIFAGVGSDEIIDLLIRLTCSPQSDTIGVLEPTYGVYQVAAHVNDVEVRTIPLDEDFQLSLKRVEADLLPSMKIVFCCSPNNPTGNLLSRETLLSLASSFTNSLLVVDEAYIEFAGGGTLAADVPLYENLIVLRTLSKAWGLAGARVGYCIAHPQLVSYLLRIKSPYNLNAASSSLAIAALANTKFLQETVALVRSERGRMAALLEDHAAVVRRVYPSDANFLLVEFQDAANVFDALYRNGIVVRKRSEERLANCLRITIGTPGENDRVISIIKGMA